MIRVFVRVDSVEEEECLADILDREPLASVLVDQVDLDIFALIPAES